MSKYEIINSASGQSLGVYEADSPDAALDACCRAAGYDSRADADAVVGHDPDLIAVELDA